MGTHLLKSTLKLTCHFGILFYLLLQCQGQPYIKVPSFNYKRLSDQFFRKKLNTYLPLTNQRESNLHPSPTQNSFLFYTSTIDGSGDIWLRNLKNTNNFPIVKHPAEQYKASASGNGKILFFVSEDKDNTGDIRRLEMNPKKISQQVLQGLTPPNLWDESTNFSIEIKAWAKENLSQKCHGDFAEVEPDTNLEGNQLLFVSDRCSPGLYNIWWAQLDEDEILELKQLTTLGGSSPRFSPNHKKIVFLSRYQKYTNQRLYLLELAKENAKAEMVPIDYGVEAPYYFSSPSFLGNENEIVYTSVKKDTNNDSKLNYKDYASIYSVSLNASGFLTEKQLLEKNTILHGLNYANLADGAIFYSADFQSNINIYFLPALGIISKEKDIESQYKQSYTYYKENQGRYLLSLDAVSHYFSHRPEYILYEAKVLLNKYKYYKETNQKLKFIEIELTIQKKEKTNPYLSLLYSLEQKKTRVLLENYQIPKNKLSKKQNRIILSRIQYDIVQYYKETGQPKKAWEVCQKLNKDYPNFYLKEKSIFEEASLHYQLFKTFPKILNKIIITSRASSRILEKVHLLTYKLYSRDQEIGTKNKWPSPVELTSIHPLVQSTFSLLKANLLFINKEYQASLNAAFHLQTKIPKYKSKFRYLPKPGWSALYTHTWLLIEKNYKYLGNLQASFSAQIEIANSYNHESNIQLSSTNFQEFIEYISQEINLYLKTARDLAQHYRSFNKKKIKKENKYLRWLQPLVKTFDFTKIKEDRLVLNNAQIEVLSNLCQEKEKSSLIIQKLNAKSSRKLIQFCKKYYSQQNIQNKVYKDIIDILYSISYTNTKTLNFLFFNMRRLSLLSNVYEKNSIHFQRLEVNIIAEKNEIALYNIDSNKLLELIVGEQEIYKTQNFLETERNYRLLYKQAVLAQDLSTLYGYAYLLIKKNIEKEKFYTKLEKVNQLLSSAFLRKEKTKILKQLKSAEYLLDYILNVDPLHMDSYLLLGWLHQYIEERKKVIVSYDGNLFEKLITKEKNTEKDANFYKEIYQVYFPDRYYEKNIELYLQALNRLEKNKVDPKMLGGLYLNLANNYFILLSFEDAKKYYALTEDVSFNFENFRQKAIFYFNYGRTLMYNSDYEKAISLFNKSGQLYQDLEYKTLLTEYQNLEFFLEANVKPDIAPQLFKEYIFRFGNIQDKLKQARTRLALISAITGLAYQQAGENKKAIEYYQLADDYLQKPSPIQGLSRANLLNYLSMAYQSDGALDISTEKAKIAGKLAKEKGLQRNDKIYQPTTYCGRSLSCILPFGEDLSVFGQGRNPYGFSTLRQYELALSLQLGNAIMKGDIEKAKKLLKKIKNTFKDHDIDVKLGKTGYTNSLNQEAYLAYQTGDYKKAHELFQKVAEYQKDFGEIKVYKDNYSNTFRSLIARLEYENWENKEEEKKDIIDDALDAINNFQENYREKTKEDFIKKRKLEFSNYEFDSAVDGAVLEEKINIDLLDINMNKAILYYHLGRTKADLSKGDRDYLKSIALLQNNIKLLEGEKGRFSIRSLYNLGRVYFKSARLKQAREVLEKVTRNSYELHLFREELLGRLLLVKVLKEIYQIHQNEEDYAEISQHIQKIESAFFNHPQLYEKIYHHAQEIRNQIVSFYIEENNPKEGLKALEKSWYLFLQWNYFRYPISFSNPRKRKLYQEIRKVRYDLFSLYQEKFKNISNNKILENIILEEKKLKEILKIKSIAMQKAYPHDAKFLESYTQKNLSLFPKLAKKQVALRIFSHKEEYEKNTKLYTWCFQNQNKSFLFLEENIGLIQKERSFWASVPSRKELWERASQKIIKECLASQKEIKDIFLIGADKFFPLNYRKIIKGINSFLPNIHFATRLNASFLGMANEAQDLSKVSFPRLFPLGKIPKKSFPILRTGMQTIASKKIKRPWKAIVRAIKKEKNLSLVLLKGKETLHYSDLALFYEVLEAHGVATLALAPQKKKIKLSNIETLAGKSSYDQSGASIFGFPGFQKKEFENIKNVEYNQDIASAKFYFSQKDYKKSWESYQNSLAKLAWQNNLEELVIDSAVALSTLEIYLLAKPSSLTHTKNLLNYVKKIKKKNIEAKIYRKNIIALVETQQIKLAQKYSSAYYRSFPEEKLKFKKHIDTLSLVSQLNNNLLASHFNDFDFYENLKDKISLELIQDLVKHGKYEVAIQLIRKWKKANLAYKESLVALIKLDQFYMGLKKFPKLSIKSRYIGKSKKLQLAYFILSLHRALWQKDISKFQKLIRQSNPQFSLANITLYKQLYRYLKENTIEEKVLEKTSSLANQNFFQNLLESSLNSFLLRKALYKASDSTNSLLSEKLLEKQKEKYSFTRMLLMSLSFAENSLEEEDFFTSSFFFSYYIKFAKKSQVDNFTKIRAKRIYSILAPHFLSQENIQKAAQLDLPKLSFDLFQKANNNSLEKINFFYEKINSLGSKNYSPASYQDIKIALALFQRRAYQKESWGTLLNVTLLKKNLKRQEYAHKNKRSFTKIQNRDYFEMLRNKIKSKQSFITLIDLHYEIICFILNKDEISVFPLEKSAQYLRAKMFAYFKLKNENKENSDLEKELYKVYSGIFFQKSNLQINYLWLDGIHAFAPLPARNTIQVFSVEKLLENPEISLNENKRIRTLGKRDLSSFPLSEKILGQKIYGIEKQALAKYTRSVSIEEAKGNWFHAFENLEKIKIMLSQNSSYFFSSNFISVQNKEDILKYHSLLENLSSKTKSLNLLALNKPNDIIHNFFVKYFYENQEKGLGNVLLRYNYTDKQTKVKASQIKKAYFSNFRLFGNSIVSFSQD